MRRIKLILAVVAAVAMLMLSAAPAMAWGRCCHRDFDDFRFRDACCIHNLNRFDRANDFVVFNRIDFDDCDWAWSPFWNRWVFVCDLD